jgi:hypothetical protein
MHGTAVKIYCVLKGKIINKWINMYVNTGYQHYNVQHDKTEAPKQADAFDQVSLNRKLVHEAPQLSSAELRRGGCVLTRRTTLCGPLQQEKSDHKVLQNRQWSTSTPKQFRLQRFRMGIDWNSIKRGSEQIWSSCSFEEFVGAPPIKLFTTPNDWILPPAATNLTPYSVFLQPQKGNKTNTFAWNKYFFFSQRKYRIDFEILGWFPFPHFTRICI